MNYYRQYRPNVFPPVVKNLLIINVLVFIAQNVIKADTFDINHTFALHGVHSVYFKPYQLITYMFMHGGIDHILFNMLALWMFGSQLENFWGPKRFLIYYLVTGLGAGLLHLLVLYFEMAPIVEQVKQMPVDIQLELINSDQYVINAITVGASGAVFGLLAAFGYLFPNSLIYVYFMIPIKAKWFVIIYGALELFLAVKNSAGDNVAHYAHLGGAITGFIMVYIWNKTNRKTLY